MKRAVVKPVELGCAGHFIAADACRWRRHTQVGRFRVSSIGNYYSSSGKREPIGAGAEALFETLVFETTQDLCRDSESCGCREVKSWNELAGRRYATAGEAQAGHERFVQRYLRKARQS